MGGPAKLSEHFTLEELTDSDVARAHGIANTPPLVHLNNMTRYLAPGLEAIRALLGGKEVYVESAYRNPQVNRLVGGTPTSAHPQGYAADILVLGIDAGALAQTIAKAMAAGSLKIDQLILESGRGVVHVSFDPRARGMRGRQPRGPRTPIDWSYFA